MVIELESRWFHLGFDVESQICRCYIDSGAAYNHRAFLLALPPDWSGSLWPLRHLLLLGLLEASAGCHVSIGAVCLPQRVSWLLALVGYCRCSLSVSWPFEVSRRCRSSGRCRNSGCSCCSPLPPSPHSRPRHAVPRSDCVPHTPSLAGTIRIWSGGSQLRLRGWVPRFLRLNALSPGGPRTCSC